MSAVPIRRTAALVVALGVLAAHPLSPLNWVVKIAQGYSP